MNLNEVAGLLGYSREQVASLVEQGLFLPKSNSKVMLEYTTVGKEVDVSDEQFDAFVAQFEAEEPGRWPPAHVRRELLVEARHKCAICLSHAPLQYHHMLDWAKTKHHDVRHMLAICGTCHSRCTIGQIDYKSQCQYKAKLTVRTESINRSELHDEIRRNSDLKTLKELYSVFPRTIVDNVLEYASRDRIHLDHIDVLDSAQSMMQSTLFHLYDAELNQRLKDFCFHWEMAWDVGRFTHRDSNFSGIATLSLTDFDSSDSWERHKTFLEHVSQAQLAHRTLNAYIREAFPEFDLSQSDIESANSYWEMVKRIERECRERWGDSPKDEASVESDASDSSENHVEDERLNDSHADLAEEH